MRLLQEAGLSRIQVGLESGDDTILKRVKKGTNAAEQIQAGRLSNKLEFNSANMSSSDWAAPIGRQSMP